ncbi:MAG TPA: hypothetical protein VFT87_00995, partial [Candidatus Saccharimonadales bacterium]|nr:hypothetical protein [Candidatus Saccharimonadales bacterium]
TPKPASTSSDPQPESSSTTSGNVAGSEAFPTTTVPVPAAGATDTFVIALGLASLTFFATKFVVQRRVG